MRILIADNNIDRDCWGSPDLRRAVAAFPGLTVSVRRGPQEDLPRRLSGYDRLIVSGSRTSCLDEASWITREDALLRQALDGGVPTLAICYGHQALARVLAGPSGGRRILRKSPTPEFGWTRIERAGDDPLFEGLPREFHSFSAHFEDVAELPPGTRLLAFSESCPVQAFRVEGRPAVGIQFHPERDLSEARKSIAGWRRDGRPLVRPDDGPRLHDPGVALTIFGNFLKGGFK